MVQSLHRSAPIIHAVCHTLKNATFGTGTVKRSDPGIVAPRARRFSSQRPDYGRAGLSEP
ncbi:hypothetical protein H4S14_001738 [Agrobacterium vitis]|nr:hypothetical protein [Agrobacterium vitis]MBE1437994.1 hypothetical protein [Agrobacterium vitis]